MSKKKKRQVILKNRLWAKPGYWMGIEREEVDGVEYLYYCDTDGACPYPVEYVEAMFKALGKTYIRNGREKFITLGDICGIN